MRYFKSWLFDLGVVLMVVGTLLAWNVASLAWNMAWVIVRGGYVAIDVSPLAFTGVLLTISGIGALVVGANRVRRNL